jgi:short-subunit dehydrogenase
MTWTRALVTGASSGIGDAFARQLAQAGTDLVVVARDEARLQRLATELSGARGVEVEVLAADLGDASQRAREEDRLRDGAAPVDLCINNAGFGTSGRFHELPIEGEVAELELNVVALTTLTHAALEAMVPRGRGAVLNVSSLACLVPGVNLATYAATKAYVTHFTEAVHQELKGTGVTATAVLPGFTRTEFQDRAGLTDDAGMPGFVWMTADAVAEAALRATADGKAICIPGRGYKIAAAVMTPVPRSARRFAAGRMSKSL